MITEGSAEVAAGTIKVLIIEDSLGYARFVYELLKLDDPYGFEIFHNVRLESGLERTLKNDIDIILLDLGLPDSTGLDTLIKVLEYNSQIPVVIFSNRNEEEFIQEAIKLGAQDYLCKGEFDSHLLRHTLKAAIERKRLLAQVEFQAEQIKTKNACQELNEKRYMQMINNLPGIFLIFDANLNLRLIRNNLNNLNRIDFSPESRKLLLERVKECCRTGKTTVTELELYIDSTVHGSFHLIPITDINSRVSEVIAAAFHIEGSN